MTWWSVGVLLASAVGALPVGVRAGRAGRGAAAGILLALLLGSVWLRYHPHLELRWLPVHVYAHVRPWASLVLALAFLGSALPQLRARRERTAVTLFAGVLLAVLAERSVRTAAGLGALTGRPHPVTGTCPQSTQYTCGAAAAATLLARHGVATTEAEMAARCVTNRLSGTDEVGVVKGLREALVGRPLTVRVTPFEDASLTDGLPAMLLVEHSPLVGHWVVAVAADHESVTLADPLLDPEVTDGGLRTVPRERLAREGRGLAIRLVAELPQAR